jgi:type IX secretion system PorP/SprF family membrane protein
MKIIKYFIIVMVLLVATGTRAQVNSFGAAFYQNQYLDNPAMAGSNQGLHLNLGYSQQWSTVPGSPSSQYVTADYRFKKVGLGLNIYSDKAGLLKQTKIIATYAYHLPLNNEDHQLHFGGSIGMFSERLNTEDISGTISDISAQRFNERDAVLDGNFGVGYTTSKLTIQGAVPNLKSFFKKERYNTENLNSFFTAMSYKFNTDTRSNTFFIEPKVSYRVVRGYDDIVDGGVNVALTSEKLYAMVIYHSTKSISCGAGANYKGMAIMGIYTSGTSALRGYSSGNFEIGLGYTFLK